MLRRILRRLFCPAYLAGIAIGFIGLMLVMAGQGVLGMIAFIVALAVVFLPRRRRRRRPRRRPRW
ncbi:MAG: hypothetical protein U9Q03_05805 [Patescibacteria group bacterium]|nr:hypothetical protein [Patescibacteria group bacterium]